MTLKEQILEYLEVTGDQCSFLKISNNVGVTDDYSAVRYKLLELTEDGLIIYDLATNTYKIAMDKECTEGTDIGRKDDNDKDDWSLLPLKLLTPMIKVLTFGEKKYSRDNWQQVSDGKNRYYSALQRHITAWQGGEKVDEDSGLPHLAHACCCLIFLMWFEDKG